jgi:MSHA type pilus biogenesis protein MshL
MPTKKFIAVALATFALACSSGGSPASQVKTSVRTEPLPSTVTQQSTGTLEPAAPPMPPQISNGGPSAGLASAPEHRLSEVVVKAGTPISRAVSELGSKLGLTVSVDPAVQGTAQVNLRNVTLTEALDQIVTHNGARYQLQGNVLRVVPLRFETRMFPLDYVAISRVGTMSTVVQRRLAGASGGITSGTATGLSSAGLAGGGDVLTAQSVNDVWNDIRVALTGIMSAGLVRATSPTGQPVENTPAAPSQAAGSAFGNGPQASSTSFADGSVLVITPSSGQINVTASPEKMLLVERFLADFQASILRQVSIAAKIVEVRLEKNFEFGIDWSVVSNSASNKVGVTIRNDPSTVTTGETGNVNFKFTGGSTTINAILTALSTQGNVSVLSNEQTTALNNQRAIFQVTTDEIFFTVNRTPLIGPNGAVATIQSSIIPTQVSVGVVLDVLPQISGDNVLTMNIRPAVTSISNVSTISLADGTSASAPNIARREGDTVARLRAGETMMIGGLVQTRREKTVSGIPVLKDIPLLGKAFQHIKDNEIKSELVVFLTPTIISGQPGR